MDKRDSQKLRIGILGGSFDPPHLGHLSIINHALENSLVDEIWLMPANENPWKKQKALAADRIAMCQFLVGDSVKISDVEIRRKGKSYTIDTVRELKRLFNHNFFWLMGSDHLADIEKFKDARELLKEIVFIAFPRTDVSSSEIRARVRKEQSIADLVPKEVEQYIINHRLYREGE